MITPDLMTPDTSLDNWVDAFAPDFAKPYLRLMRADRPVGTWLLLIPCWWGLTLGNGVMTDASLGIKQTLWFALLFTIGAFVMRGAGCVYNDIIDKDIDAEVARTALRPIPSGQVSVRRAWVFLGVLCLIGLAVLLQFNTVAIVTGIAALVLVAGYPFMKRITWWPQAWLGMTFNWGALVGFAAVTGTICLSAILLWAAGLFWTLGYDTIYAHQDKEDDMRIGVKSSALRLGDNTARALKKFYTMTIAFLAFAGLSSGFGGFYLLALAMPALHFIWQLDRLNIDNGDMCLKLFKSNRDAGLLALAALFIGTIIL